MSCHRLLSALLLLLLGAGSVAADAPDGAPTPAQSVDRALELLHSPLAARRERGVERLYELLSGSARERILTAFPKATPPVQQEMVIVLAADAGADAIALLLQHLMYGAAGETSSVMLTMARARAVVDYLSPHLAKDPELKALAKPKQGEPTERLAALVRLIRRAEIERILVSKKSKSGGTGYYKGQYEELRAYGHRDAAVQILTGIALDEAIPVPGVFTGGVYDFVHSHDVDLFELRGMAVNALSELAKPSDHKVLGQLSKKLYAMWEHIQQRRKELSKVHNDIFEARDIKRFDDDVFELGAQVGEMSDYLMCLFLVNPDLYTGLLDEFLRDLRDEWEYPVRPLNIAGMVPNILIRAGRFERAVTSYLTELRRSWNSKSFIYYNMACAYACWSREPGERDAESLRGQALWALERSVRTGWRDLGWMEEDRDLDPIRDSDRYRVLVQFIKTDLDMK